MGFPTKNDHFGVFGGYHYLRKHPHERLWSFEGWKDLYRFALKLEPQGPQLGSCEIAKKHPVCSCEGLGWMNWSPAMRRCCCNKSEGGE